MCHCTKETAVIIVSLSLISTLLCLLASCGTGTSASSLQSREVMLGFLPVWSQELRERMSGQPQEAAAWYTRTPHHPLYSQPFV